MAVQIEATVQGAAQATAHQCSFADTSRSNGAQCTEDIQVIDYAAAKVLANEALTLENQRAGQVGSLDFQQAHLQPNML